MTPTRKDSANSTEDYPSRGANGNSVNHSDEDIPENMYRPDKDDPEGWIHRDKLAKIESEELQAAGINLANARSRSQSKLKSIRDTSRDGASRRGEKRQRLQSPAQIEDEVEQDEWDIRLPEEIEEEHSAAAQLYANPVLRKSGSKIPVLASSPNPIPAERYERDTPIARKRTASGTMSFEGDLAVPKTRNAGSNKVMEDSDTTSSAIASSKPGSPQKSRSKSVTLAVSPPAVTTQKKTTPASRKTSAPARATPSPNQRPGTRSGEQDRPRTAVTRPEGDPPWLATMYKPDPRLPPEQQLIPTLAKKQMQAQWAEDGAIPKTYDRTFTPIAVHTDEDLAREVPRNRSSSSADPTPPDEEKLAEPNAWPLRPVSSIRSSSGRPGTAGSTTGGYSTMPKVTSPPVRESSPKIGSGATPALAGRSTAAPPPTRMHAQSLATDDDEKVKKGCGCCVVM